jgi:tryptophanyl-tRNA synthetase
MSKSYGNDISLSDTPEEITKKIKTMMTDPARKRRTDPGDPDVCPVFAYHKIYSPDETIQTVDRECRVAGIGCIDCKKWMSERLIENISPLLQRRQEYAKRTGEINDIIADGNRRASAVAGQTMDQVREAVQLS